MKSVLFRRVDAILTDLHKQPTSAGDYTQYLDTGSPLEPRLCQLICLNLDKSYTFGVWKLSSVHTCLIRDTKGRSSDCSVDKLVSSVAKFLAEVGSRWDIYTDDGASVVFERFRQLNAILAEDELFTTIIRWALPPNDVSGISDNTCIRFRVKNDEVFKKLRSLTGMFHGK